MSPSARSRWGGTLIFASDARNYALEDGRTPAPLYPNDQPQGAGKYAVTAGQLPTFLNRLHRMRITMSFNFGAAPPRRMLCNCSDALHATCDSSPDSVIVSWALLKFAAMFTAGGGEAG